MLREALDKILGERVDEELAKEIIETTSSIDGVRGAYDLILSDYGPQRLWGSLHVEVDESLGARDIDRIEREIQATVYRQHKVILHTVGVYATNTSEGPEAQAIHKALDEIVEREPYVLQVHGLYVDTKVKGCTFDIVIAYEAGNRESLRQRIIDEMHERFPDYAFVAVLDSDVA